MLKNKNDKNDLNKIEVPTNKFSRGFAQLLKILTETKFM